jgi:SprT-like family.
MATITRPASITVDLVSALDAAWAAIQQRHGDVPAVVLTLGSGTLGVKAGEERLGHFAAGRWQHDQARVPELFIGGEGLRRGALEVMATLLHEAAHGLAHTRQIKDTSRQGRYHNAHYRTLASEVGLDVAETGAIGWSATTLAVGTAQHYRAELAAIEAALVAFRHPEARRDPSQKNKNGTTARCPCGRQFRITVSVLDAGPIVCGICGEPFEGQRPLGEDDEV